MLDPHQRNVPFLYPVTREVRTKVNIENTQKQIIRGITLVGHSILFDKLWELLLFYYSLSLNDIKLVFSCAIYIFCLQVMIWSLKRSWISYNIFWHLYNYVCFKLYNVMISNYYGSILNIQLCFQSRYNNVKKDECGAFFLFEELNIYYKDGRSWHSSVKFLKSFLLLLFFCFVYYANSNSYKFIICNISTTNTTFHRYMCNMCATGKS